VVTSRNVIQAARPAVPITKAQALSSRGSLARNTGSARRVLLVLLVLILLLLFLVVPGVSAWSGADAARQEDARQQSNSTPPQEWYVAPARELSKKIMRILGRQDAISLRFENRSGLAAAEVAAIRAAIETEMKRLGARTTSGVGTAGATITFSENVRGLLWVAEVSDEKSDVVLMEVRQPAGNGDSALSGIALEKDLLWSQEAPLLDVSDLPAAADHDAYVVLLEPARLQLARRAGRGLEVVRIVELPRSTADPRVPQGRVGQDGEGMQVVFAREQCQVPWSPTAAVHCQPSAQNATVPASDAEQGGGQRAELAPVCARGRYQLRAGQADWTEPDTIQVFQARGNEWVAAGSRVPLPGPVMSLLPSGQGDSAWAVVKNLTSGKYEVYSLSISCGR